MASKTHWTEGLKKILAERGSSPQGEGWATFREIKAELKRGDSFVHKLLNDLVRKKKCEIFRGSEINESGQLYCQTWYRLIS